MTDINPSSPLTECEVFYESRSRLELLVDDWLVDRFEGDAALHLHEPLGKEVVLMNDKAWEDTSLGYVSVLKDGDLFRMYYRGHHHGSGEDARGEPMCYAESRDGIRWTKPNLGLFSFRGSSATTSSSVGMAESTSPPTSGKANWEPTPAWDGAATWSRSSTPAQLSNPTLGTRHWSAGLVVRTRFRENTSITACIPSSRRTDFTGR